MQLSTARFQLKEIEPQHIEYIHKGLSDERITEFYDVHFPTLDSVQEQMDWYAGLKKNNTGIWWVIFSGSNEFCGAVGFNNWESDHRKAEIGLWLLSDYWGQGIMAEVMQVVLDYGFNKLNLNRVEGIVQSANKKCVKALEKVSFVHEGSLRENEIKNGEFINVEIFALLKNDWDRLEK